MVSLPLPLRVVALTQGICVEDAPEIVFSARSPPVPAQINLQNRRSTAKGDCYLKCAAFKLRAS